jgi:hypothetical protein
MFVYYGKGVQDIGCEVLECFVCVSAYLKRKKERKKRERERKVKSELRRLWVY